MKSVYVMQNTRVITVGGLSSVEVCYLLILKFVMVLGSVRKMGVAFHKYGLRIVASVLPR